MIAVIKVTKWCNLACEYCYMDIDSSTTSAVIDFSTIQRIVEEFGRRWCHVNYSWHGGEPLKAGIPFFSTAIDIQNNFYQNNPERSYANTIQTNGLLLNSKWLKFFNRSDFGIGISYDGPAELNDLRHSHKGFAVSEKIKNKISLIQDITGKPPWVICVITKHNINNAESIYEHFVDIGLNGFSILPYLGKKPHLRITDDEYYNFHKTIFDMWMSEAEPKLNKITPLTQLIDSLLSKRNTICSWEGRCFRDLLTIDPTGNIQLCSAFHQAEYGIGSLMSKSIDSLLSSKIYQNALSKQDRVLSTCSQCDVFDICRGGCREAAFHTFGDIRREDPLCLGRRKLIFYVSSFIVDKLRKSKSMNSSHC